MPVCVKVSGPVNRSYRQVWVLRIEHRSFGRAVRVLNC